MDYVKIKLEAWVDDTIAEIRRQHSDPLCGIYWQFLDEILPLYRGWAISHYEGEIVDSPHIVAETFLQEGAYMVRTEEDAFLMNELKTRTTTMTCDEWERYCVDKDAIAWTPNFALLTDGF